MRHQRRLSFTKEGEGEQFNNQLLPYPEKASKIHKKCDLYPEFMFCIPVKPISNVLGYDLDVFVRQTTVISIIIWTVLLFLEGSFLYLQEFEFKSNSLFIVALSIGIVIVSIGIFCGFIGFIGCSIPNSMCIYIFYLQITVQIIVNAYAIAASLIRGYLSYTLIYSLSLVLDASFLFPTWSLYIYVKLNGVPPNITKYGGLLSELLSACEYKDEHKLNPGEPKKSTCNAHSESKSEVRSNSSTSNTKASLYRSDLSDKAKNFVAESITGQKQKLIVIKKSIRDRNYLPASSSDNASEKAGRLDDTNRVNPEVYIEIPDVLGKDDAQDVNKEKKITFNWSKPSISVGRSIITYSNTAIGDSNDEATHTTSQKRYKYGRTDIYNGL